MEYFEIVTKLHKKTERDYFSRMQNEKVHCMKVAKEYGHEYWDGDRKYGFGGYKYDGRWKRVAEDLISNFHLKDGDSILDVGCGKGFLLYELQQLLPNSRIVGFDISAYAAENAKEEIRENIFVHDAGKPFPFQAHEFNFVFSINTLHNLKIYNLLTSLQEMQRVGKTQYVCVESFRNEQELFNLQCWALTCQAFYSVDEWEWLFLECRMTGGYEFIFFE